MYLVPITLATEWSNWWVNQQCNFDPDTVPQFLLYFPVVILIVAISLFLVEKFFDVAFKVGDEAKHFYDLLVKLKVLDKKGKKKLKVASEKINPSFYECLPILSHFQKILYKMYV